MPAASEAVPSTAVPSRNVTMPLGVPPLPLTVAVKVTDCPALLGLAEEASVTVAAAALAPAATVWVSAGEVPAAKFASPA